MSRRLLAVSDYQHKLSHILGLTRLTSRLSWVKVKMSLPIYFLSFARSAISAIPDALLSSLLGAVQRLLLWYLCFVSVFIVIPLVAACEVLVRLQLIEQHEAHRKRCQDEPGFREHTILITGINSIKGIFLARSFYLSGHTVIGSDFEWFSLLSPARFSCTLAKFHSLPLHLKFGDLEPSTYDYAEEILGLMDDTSIDLWICCSTPGRILLLDARAKQLVEERSRCRCVQFDGATALRLQGTPRNLFSLVEAEVGVSLPETHKVTSKETVRYIQQIRNWSGKDSGQKFVLRPDTPATKPRIGPGYLIEILAKTYQLDISPSSPWILEQHISDGPYYRSHSLIVCGRLALFFVCPIFPEEVSRPGIRSSRKPGFFHCPLEPDDNHHRTMRDFTETFVRMTSSSQNPMTGHLNFDFVLDTSRDQSSGEKLHVLSCSTLVRTALTLFGPSSFDLEWEKSCGMRAMVQTYLSVLAKEDEAEDISIGIPVNPKHGPPPQYHIPPEIYSPEDANSYAPYTGPNQPPPDDPESGPASSLPTPPPTPPTSAQATTPSSPLAPQSQNGGNHHYLVSHHLIARILYPLVQAITRQITLNEFYATAARFVDDSLQWKELGFEAWDPLPFFLFFVYSLFEGWWSHQF